MKNFWEGCRPPELRGAASHGLAPLPKIFHRLVFGDLMNPNTDRRIVEFLSLLHREGKHALIWTRPARASWWWDVGELMPVIPDGPRHQDIYFQVHPSNAIPQLDDAGVEQPKENVRGRLADLAAVNCLFADFDAGAFGGDLNEVRKYVASLTQPEPSFIVCSGGGLHAYWVFEDPWIIADDGERQRASQLQRAWVELVGGDRNAADMARVLRLPGTINHKPAYGAAGAAVEFETFNPENLHCRTTLENLIDPAALEPRAETSRRQSRSVSPEKLLEIQAALDDLSIERVQTYSAWVEIGMSLVELGDLGLELWRSWSAKSEKYRKGECEYKWGTFKPFTGETLKTLFWRADEDRQMQTPGPHVTRARRPMSSAQVERALEELGMHFATNEMTGMVYVNGEPLDDPLHDTVFTILYDHRYTNERLLRATISRLGRRNSFHPVRDYLIGLQYDHEDHIGKLCSYFSDTNDVFRLWLPKWLVGAVARVLKPNVQNRVLVLDGAQNLGKSYFAQWLFRPLPDLFIEAAVDPEDKDCRMRRAFVWGWEIDEMGATMRRRDTEALKSFITNTAMTERVPYGRADRTLKPIASFIGTINNQAGFLNDPTGARRFMVATLTRLDWRYAAEIDPNQVWAQAVYMLNNNYPWQLASEEYALSEKINREDYQVVDPLEEVINGLLVMCPDGQFASGQLLKALQLGGMIRSATDRGEAMRVGSILTSMGLRSKRLRNAAGNQVRSWTGATLDARVLANITLNGSVE
jgi:predicted P-loop ATPase